MEIKSIVETSYLGMFKVMPTEGPSFFVRAEYLPGIDFESVCAGSVFNEEQSDLFFDAGLICAVELKAVDYLARAEQCRFNLTQKLIKKEYSKKYIEAALDFLESKNYLSDERFARAWLHARRLNHYEGRSKLMAELASRGINKEISKNAVEEFFTENDEMGICKKAYNKFVKRGKSDEKLIAALLQSGFTYRQIKEVEEDL